MEVLTSGTQAYTHTISPTSTKAVSRELRSRFAPPGPKDSSECTRAPLTVWAASPAPHSRMGNRGSSAGWSGNRAANCIAEAASPAPPSTVPANPLPTRTLGKWKFFATAKDDVDIYAGPGGNFENTGVVMRKDERALSLRQHPDGWRMLQLTCGKPECWVAEDHLKIVGIPPLGAKCPAGARREADGCHF